MSGSEQGGGDGGSSPQRRAPRRDPWDALRKTVGQSIVVFTIPFVFSIGRAVFGATRLKVEREAVDWAVWGTGVALMAAASVLAIQALRGKLPEARAGRAVWLAGGVWLAGLLLAIVYAQMVPAPTLR